MTVKTGDKPIISKIEIKIGDSVARLTPKQAGQLRDALNALLGGPASIIINPVHQPWWYIYTVKTEPMPWTQIDYGATTWGGDTATLMLAGV